MGPLERILVGLRAFCDTTPSWYNMEMDRAEAIDVGWIDPEMLSGHFAHSIATQVRDMEYHGCAGRIYRHSASQPIVARNNLVREFLNESDSPWLWMVDADMVFDKGHVMKLWSAASEYQADIVSGLAMIWKQSHEAGKHIAVPSYFYHDKEEPVIGQVLNHLPKSGAQIAASGLASVLVHRRVFEAMRAPRTEDYRWFDFLPEHEIGVTGDEMAGIDVQFFMRAGHLGFKQIAEPEAQTWHLEGIAVGYEEWRKQWQSES